MTSGDAWNAYKKTVKPIAEKITASVPPPPRKRAVIRALPMEERLAREADLRKKVSAGPLKPLAVGLDKSYERKIRKGDLTIEGKLDLHGMTQKEAFDVLVRFVTVHAEVGARRLLVITGRGREGQSILRANLPQWCETAPLSALVMALREAAPHHGGAGAFYLLLRRRR